MRFRLYLFGGLVLVLVLAGIYQFWLRDSSLVSIRDLEVVGIPAKSKEGEQIDQAVRTAMGEMTVLNVDQDLLDEELSRFPRVAATQIETSLPDKATVTLTLRENGSIFGSGSNALLIATDGVVLGGAAGQEGELPLISEGDPPVASETEGESDGAGDGEVEVTTSSLPGSKLTGRTLNQALILGASPPELRTFIDRSSISKGGVEVFFENGPTLLFGDATHADQKWRAAAALIADPEFDTGSYVDLTVPRRPGVTSDEDLGEVPAEGTTGVTEAILPE